MSVATWLIWPIPHPVTYPEVKRENLISSEGTEFMTVHETLLWGPIRNSSCHCPWIGIKDSNSVRSTLEVTFIANHTAVAPLETRSPQSVIMYRPPVFLVVSAHFFSLRRRRQLEQEYCRAN